MDARENAVKTNLFEDLKYKNKEKDITPLKLNGARHGRRHSIDPFATKRSAHED